MRAHQRPGALGAAAPPARRSGAVPAACRSAALQRARVPPAALPRPAHAPRRRHRAARPLRALTEPQELVGVPEDAPAATYTLRIMTGTRREDELSEPDAALLVTLISADGRAVLHRDAAQSGGYGRGERGGADTLRVRAPADFGAPAALWLAAERGTWRVERATVRVEGGAADGCERRYEASASFDTGTELRPADDPSAFPQLSDAERAARRAAGLAAYEALKQRLLAATAALGLLGTGIAARLGGEHAALPFAAGAAAGLLYLLLLERGVDALPGADVGFGDDDVAPAGSGTAGAEAAQRRGAAGGTGAAGRLALVALLAVAGAKQLATGAALPSGAGLTELRVELAAGAAGFLTYKLAVLLVGLLWPQQEAPQSGDGPPPPAA